MPVPAPDPPINPSTHPSSSHFRPTPHAHANPNNNGTHPSNNSRPPPTPTNTLILARVPSPLFANPALSLPFMNQFSSYGDMRCWGPMPSFKRIFVVYTKVEDAEKAKFDMDRFGWDDDDFDDFDVDVGIHNHSSHPPLRVYFGPPLSPTSLASTTLPTPSHPHTSSITPHFHPPPSSYLAVPTLDTKNFLISPPGSPPVGWEQVREDPPNARTVAWGDEEGAEGDRDGGEGGEAAGGGVDEGVMAEDLVRALRYLSVGVGEEEDEDKEEDEQQQRQREPEIAVDIKTLPNNSGKEMVQEVLVSTNSTNNNPTSSTSTSRSSQPVRTRTLLTPPSNNPSNIPSLNVVAPPVSPKLSPSTPGTATGVPKSVTSVKATVESMGGSGGGTGSGTGVMGNGSGSGSERRGGRIKVSTNGNGANGQEEEEDSSSFPPGSPIDVHHHHLDHYDHAHDDGRNDSFHNNNGGVRRPTIGINDDDDSSGTARGGDGTMGTRIGLPTSRIMPTARPPV